MTPSAFSCLNFLDLAFWNDLKGEKWQRVTETAKVSKNKRVLLKIMIEKRKELEEKIRTRILHNGDWAYPYLIEEFKEEPLDISESIIDEIYFSAVKSKVNSLSINELRALLAEQKKLTDANRIFFVINLIEEKLSSN